ncbi:class I SAM-dependent methyltransferase [Luteimonas sp. TWI1437]|uniref:class I SAM-dependent methyltransferase n=1 Tax=unclassified Luteimonas TaxID=2629088 RepID=UPI00320B1D7E
MTAADAQIRFDDGARYERYMAIWSRLVGDRFLGWLAPAPGLDWLDVGCGNGAFTQTLIARCAPAQVYGLDPSVPQVAHARARLAGDAAHLLAGDAMALPFPPASVDALVMPLVIFFVPDPERGVAEMVRVGRPGALVSAYAWDLTGGGFPYHALQARLRARGVVLPAPPSPDASRVEVLQALWAGVGLCEVRTHSIEVRRTFADFDDYWQTVLEAPSIGPQLARWQPAQVAQFAAEVRAELPVDGANGAITVGARAHAVAGRVPGGR